MEESMTPSAPDLFQEYQNVLRAASRAERTIGSYLGALRQFDEFLGERTLEGASAEDVRRYLTHLAERGKSDSTIHVATYALRGFSRYVLRRPDWAEVHLPRPRRPKRLPEVLDPQEVEALFQAAPSPKYRAAFMTCYGSGLRTDEILQLEPGHVDSRRMVIRVALGKGRKDRDVVLPLRLLTELRECFRRYRPKRYLFEGKRPGQPMAATSLQRACSHARRKAGITKPVSLRGLRHAFATHLVEAGTNLRVIQALLGHQSLSTTTVYTHLAKNWLGEVTSPLDRIKQG
jgi:site-specific recombinase XerD